MFLPTTPVVLAPTDQVGRFFTGREVYVGYAKHNLPLPLVSPPTLANIMRHTSDLLDPWRLMIGPVTVNSWFRTKELNRLVYGSHTSLHLEGLATDCVPLKMPLLLAFEKLRLSDLPYDQIIIYPARGFIHVGSCASSGTPRRMALISTQDKKYAPYPA